MLHDRKLSVLLYISALTDVDVLALKLTLAATSDSPRFRQRSWWVRLTCTVFSLGHREATKEAMGRLRKQDQAGTLPSCSAIAFMDWSMSSLIQNAVKSNQVA